MQDPLVAEQVASALGKANPFGEREGVRSVFYDLTVAQQLKTTSIWTMARK